MVFMAKAASLSTPGAHGALQALLGVPGRELSPPERQEPLRKEGIIPVPWPWAAAYPFALDSGSLGGDRPNPGGS